MTANAPIVYERGKGIETTPLAGERRSVAVDSHRSGRRGYTPQSPCTGITDAPAAHSGDRHRRHNDDLPPYQTRVNRGQDWPSGVNTMHICTRCQCPMLQRIRTGVVESARCGCGNIARPTRRFIRRRITI